MRVDDKDGKKQLGLHQFSKRKVPKLSMDHGERDWLNSCRRPTCPDRPPVRDMHDELHSAPMKPRRTNINVHCPFSWVGMVIFEISSNTVRLSIVSFGGNIIETSSIRWLSDRQASITVRILHCLAPTVAARRLFIVVH